MAIHRLTMAIMCFAHGEFANEKRSIEYVQRSERSEIGKLTDVCQGQSPQKEKLTAILEHHPWNWESNAESVL